MTGRYPAKSLIDVYVMLDNLKLDEDGCIYWLGKKPGYHSRVKIGNKYFYISRLVLERKLGRSLKYWALHICDHGGCVNPDHLYEGTPKDNVHDMIRRNPNASVNIKRTSAQLEALINWARSPENLERIKGLRYK